MVAILLLDGVMIIISYNNYFAISKHVVTIRNASVDLLHSQESGTGISYRSPVIANFLLNFSTFRYHGNRGWSETNFTYTIKFADPENPLTGARIRNMSPIEAQL